MFFKMKYLYLIATVLLLNILSGYATEPVRLIPQPSEVEQFDGLFSLRDNIKIIGNSETKNEATFLANVLQKGFGHTPKIETRGQGIKLQIDKGLKNQLGAEGYLLSTTGKNIILKAATSAGIFYGIQTFRQLLPADFEHNNAAKAVDIPRVEITDKPRFSWRAFMLDESRHFKGAEEVKKLLDEMARLKMNTFHWHLTDDQGWRIEIKKYPKLTEIGSKRNDTQTARRSEGRTGKPHEGFYTQEQIKDIIRYAADRHITIVPEIEMPGHAMAAIAAYPWLGSLGTTTEVPVTFGKMDDSFNISDPNVIQFLKDILDEVMALFPGKVIHIGGDEVNFKTWENSQAVQDFMKKENLKTPVDLQIYFTNLISNYIDSKGKRMMGWNEIMGDDIHGERTANDTKPGQKLAKSAIVHFWKGNLDLINRAVAEGYDVVNSNHWDTYLDYTYERLPLSKSYAFNPIPDGLDKKYQSHILGYGTQIWSEWLPTVESMEKQIFPRLAAYAEVGWTKLDNKDYNRFLRALENLKKRWNTEGIYYTPDLPGAQKIDERTQYFPKQQIPIRQLPSKDKVWVFIMAGQSNMAGRGLVAPQDTVPQQNIITINDKNEWIQAKEPLHFYQPNLTGLDCGMSFARKLASEVDNDITIAILPAAVGGSSIKYWLNDSIFNGVHLRSNLIEKINLAKQYGTLKGVLWHQGESDATPEKIPEYECNLKKLFYLMRFIAQDNDLPIVAGELGTKAVDKTMKENWSKITTIIHKVVAETPDTYIVNTGDLNVKADHVHFDAPSQRLLGERYAEKFSVILKEKNASGFKK